MASTDVAQLDARVSPGGVSVETVTGAGGECALRVTLATRPEDGA